MNDKPLFPPPSQIKDMPGEDLVTLTFIIGGLIVLILASWKSLELMAQAYVWIDRVLK